MRKPCQAPDEFNSISVIQAFLSRCIDEDTLPTSNSYCEQIAPHFSNKEIGALKNLVRDYSA